MEQKALEADASVIWQFLGHLTQDWDQFGEHQGVFEVRCLGENRTPLSERFALHAFEDAIDFVIKWNKLKLNIYATVNPIDQKSESPAKDEHILRAHFSFADADDLVGLNGLKKINAHCAPDIFVTTGTNPHERRHAYWRLKEPCFDLLEWKQTQSKLAYALGTDRSVVNPSRIMRVAGTVSYPNTAKKLKGYEPELTTVSLGKV